MDKVIGRGRCHCLSPLLWSLLYFQGVQEDIKTLQLNVRSINSIAESFMDEAEPQFRVSAVCHHVIVKG